MEPQKTAEDRRKLLGPKRVFSYTYGNGFMSLPRLPFEFFSAVFCGFLRLLDPCATKNV